MTELRASVRQVVEFSLHERDLSPAAFAAKRMREGAAAHKARQSAGAREETAYQAEKSLSADYAAREITLRVTGRADGLLLAADGARIVEEIKLGTAENPLVPAHRAQAAMYGHMLCQKEGLTGVRLRILYVDENGAFDRLMIAGERLIAVIKKCQGMANKDLGKFADQINSLCDKWDR